ncbi:hypothetical protein QG145_06240, partial [Kingella kingae]|nr:hypothetical protein [Kingella kingae]
LPTPLCAICTRRALSPCPIFISFHYKKAACTLKSTKVQAAFSHFLIIHINMPTNRRITVLR